MARIKTYFWEYNISEINLFLECNMRDTKTRQDKTRQDKTRQDKTRQDKTNTTQTQTQTQTQDNTRQHKTTQDNTQHDTTRHDTTRHDTTQHNTRRPLTAVSLIAARWTADHPSLSVMLMMSLSDRRSSRLYWSLDAASSTAFRHWTWPAWTRQCSGVQRDYNEVRGQRGQWHNRTRKITDMES